MTGMVRPPQQARSRRTLHRLEQAALDLLRDQGLEGVTVAEVVARARSSVGSFYARFQGKEDLLRHLEVRFWEEALERWGGMVEGWRRGGAIPSRDRVRRSVHFLVELEEDLRGFRGGATAGWQPPGPALRLHDQVAEILADAVSGEAGGEGLDGAEERAARAAIGVRLIRSAAVALLNSGGGRAGDGQEPLPASVVVALLEEVLLALLGEGSPGPGIRDGWGPDHPHPKEEMGKEPESPSMMSPETLRLRPADPGANPPGLRFRLEPRHDGDAPERAGSGATAPNPSGSGLARGIGDPIGAETAPPPEDFFDVWS